MEKHILLVVCVGLWMLPLKGYSQEDELKVGDPEAEVHQTLGPPHNFAKMGGKSFLYYKRGHVVVEGGQVTQVQLLSEARYQARKEAQAERAEAQHNREETALEAAAQAAQARKAQAEARRAEAQAAFVETELAWEVAKRYIRPRSPTVTPALSANPIQGYRRSIRSQRLQRSFLERRVGPVHSFAPICDRLSYKGPIHLYRQYR